MRRNITNSLIKWKKDHVRLPLMVRGARQIGKSYVIREFGREQFVHFLEINFEFEPQFKDCFTSLDPEKIVLDIELLTRQTITPQKTLLFLDEIQECPQAILALRYFKERMPNLHVISAGSLIEFVLNDADFRMPVGRVQYLFMQPLSFYEYLYAKAEDKLVQYLQNISIDDDISKAAHEKLLALFREYLIVGGMPDAVMTFLNKKSLLQAQERQLVLLNTFKNDFGKYAKYSEHKYLQSIYAKVPSLVAKQFKYTEIDPDSRARQLKPALYKLIEANIIRPVYATTAAGIPLAATTTDKKMKLCFLDVGLMIKASHLSAELLLQDDFYALNRGNIMEQFVAQEFCANTDPLEEAQLYYWYRDKKSSVAELDYVRQVGRDIIPVEVKAGTTGSLKSLRMFMEEKKSKLGVHISAKPLQYIKPILSLPCYFDC